MIILDLMYLIISFFLILIRVICVINCGGGDFFFGNYDIKYRKIEICVRNWSEYDFERSFYILLCFVVFFKLCMDYLVLGDLNIMMCWIFIDMNVFGKIFNYYKIFRFYLILKWI